jgi:hypothetical protein
VPIVAALIAGIPLWLEVIKPRLDNDPTPTPPAVAQPTLPNQNDLRVALLEEGDLPEGWLITPARVVEEPCGIHYRRGVASVQRALHYPTDLAAPYIYHEVSAFDAGAAKTELDGIIATMDGCQSSMSTAPGGEVVPSAIDPFTVAQLGDQSYGFREVVVGAAGVYLTDTVFVRYDDVLSILVITLTLGPDEEDPQFNSFVDNMALLVDAKLAQALGR